MVKKGRKLQNQGQAFLRDRESPDTHQRGKKVLDPLKYSGLAPGTVKINQSKEKGKNHRRGTA